MVNELWQHSSVAQGLKEEGRVEEARELAQTALGRRFGTLAQDAVAALNRADATTLEDIILDSSLTLEQARARLGLS